MGKRFVLMSVLMLTMALGNEAMAQQQKKQKSAKKLAKQYVDYVKGKDKGKEQIARKNASDPATVTRDRDSTKQDRPRTFQDEYEAFRQQSKADYESFRDKANREYAEFMRKAWEEYGVMPAKPQPKEEEVPPVVMPEEDRAKPVEDTPVPIIEEEIIVPPEPEPQPVPVDPIREKPQPVEQYVPFTVYGTEMQVRFGDEQRFTLASCSEDDVADAWLRLSGSDYNNTIRDCLELRIRRQLSDWAYLNMLREMATACLGQSNEATLLMAFVYCQSGYQMRLGIADGGLYLLYASKHLIYERSYYNLDGEHFYPFGTEPQRMRICEAGFPQERALSLYVPAEQQLAYSPTPLRTLKTEYYRDMSVEVCVNRNDINFYNGYPTSMIGNDFMTRWAMYANTPMPQRVKDGLYTALKKILKGKTPLEAVERILNWTQLAFEYKLDDKVWGYDRAFFPVETLYYPYCDCEDRAILMSRIVRDLLGLDCILVYYPGHLAMAVNFSSDVKGDYIMVGGRKFVVCDPTYYYAPVGKTMPRMDNATAKVILLEK